MNKSMKYSNERKKFQTKCGEQFVIFIEDGRIEYSLTSTFCCIGTGTYRNSAFRVSFLKSVGITHDTVLYTEEIEENIKLWILLNGYELL